MPHPEERRRPASHLQSTHKIKWAIPECEIESPYLNLLLPLVIEFVPRLLTFIVYGLDVGCGMLVPFLVGVILLLGRAVVMRNSPPKSWRRWRGPVALCQGIEWPRRRSKTEHSLPGIDGAG